MTALRFRTTMFRLIPMLLLVGLLAAGCHTQRPAVRTPQSSPSVEAWTRMQVPVTVSLSSPQSMSVSGTLTMLRDSSIVLSFRMIGMEVAVVAFEADSVAVLDKFHKRAFKTGIDRIMANTSLTVGELQNILTGHYPPSLRRLPAGVKYSRVDTDDRSGILISRTGSAPEKKLCEIMTLATQLTPFGDMAAKTGLEFYPKDKKVEGTLTLNFDKVKWNDEVTPRKITIPSGYKRIEFDEPLKMLLNP